MLPTTSTGLALQGTPTTAPNTTISGTNNLGVSGSSALGGVSTLGGAAGTGAAGSAATSGQGANGGITGGTLPLGSNVSGINVGVPSASTGTSTGTNANTALLPGSNETVAQFLQSIQAMDQANLPGVAPTINLNALNATAQSQAASTVNPLYTQYMNEYLQNEAANQTAAQSQNTLNLQQEQAALGNTLAQNTLSQQAAASGNALTQGNINAQAANYQLNSGNAQNAKIQTLQQSMGQSGLALSGYGQGQLWQAENLRNAADAQQQGQFQYQRDTGNMSTQDTFAQLAQSSQYAQTGETEQEAQTNFNLNDYLRQAAANDQAYTQSLQTWQQQAQTSTAQNLLAQAVQQQLQGYTGKTYAAGEQAYAPQLQTTSAPSAPDIASYMNQLTPGTQV